MEKIATDTFDFEYMRSKGITYVDKTALIHALAEGSIGKQFFLSRPRRFGKSLLCSTLQKLFEGRRNLFEGLAVADLPWDWSKSYPVIRLDMSLCSGETLAEVEAAVETALRNEARRLGVGLYAEGGLREKFLMLVKDVAAMGPHKQCVLLIDEYDKPLTRWVGTPEVTPFQTFLKSFYSVVKATESEQRFCLMTGVLKVSLASPFGGLNNLNDITMRQEFSGLLGFSRKEIAAYFPQSLESLAKTLGVGPVEMLQRIEEAVGVYSFTSPATKVCHPHLVGRYLESGSISRGEEPELPEYLKLVVERNPLHGRALVISDNDLNAFEPDMPSLLPVLFQTGYLTIKESEKLERITIYTLGFPNSETLHYRAAS